jgi:hypothetical protein
MKISFKSISLLVFIVFVFTNNGFGQGFVIPIKTGTPDPKLPINKTPIKPKGPIIPADVTNIDSIIRPISIITKETNDKIDANLLKIDLLDGEQNNIVKNYKGETID